MGTLVVNVLGCLVLGAVMEASLSAGVLSSEGRAAVTIGFLGAFTTFSTFGYETFRILEARQWGLVAANLGAQLGLGLLGVTAGVMLGRWAASLL